MVTNEKIKLGLSQWSFHRAFFGNSRDNYEQFIADLHSKTPQKILKGEMDENGLIQVAQKLDVKIIDLVNILFMSHLEDDLWLKQWRNNAEKNGVSFNCLMCDEIGNLGASSERERTTAIELHKKWINTAAKLGCNMVRVNAYGDGTYLNQLEKNTKSLISLAAHAQPLNINIVVENHGHPSSNGAWLAMLMENVSLDNVGVYLDFDNFFMGGWNHNPKRLYDRDQGMHDLAPYTLGASAKSYHFNNAGEETTVDFNKCINILIKNGFTGVIAAEFEGDVMSEYEGTQATLKLLEKTLSHPKNYSNSI
ncbi:TIM barrel protein [Vibrio sp. TH_r3]|uniref:sugar phosphate isomerase/epimerase family protein n=1 Tax=Vibrio sp. TH_r3 TaxID=3082084 RepID=UPI00295569DE|nr:TIM barrel protein [Vibrio sp. TH_r3]MDV7105108.1 TIM barrel protein [Vibrio sp. TH_r3]